MKKIKLLLIALFLVPFNVMAYSDYIIPGGDTIGIEINSKGNITLTESGLAIAEKTLEKHIILTKMLMSLGVDETSAMQDACKMEHDISDKTWETIKKHWDNRK